MMHKWRASLFTLLLVGALGLIFLTTGLAYAAAPADTISYWKLDETTPDVPGDAGTYTDSVGTNDGVSDGLSPRLSPTPSDPSDPDAAQVGGAQVFDGSDTGIDVPADASFDWAVDDSFSIEYWVRRDAIPGGTEVIVGRDDNSTSLHWWTGLEGGTGTVSFNLQATDGNGLYLTGTTVVADGLWHHVVAVRDDSTGENLNFIYVDGAEDASGVFDYGAGFDSALASINIGWLNLSPFYHFGGVLDEVALYNRALTPAEIAKHHTDGRAGKGIDYVAPAPPVIPPTTGGGGDGGGCFIGTAAK